jgi:signal transduction histidine kinase
MYRRAMVAARLLLRSLVFASLLVMPLQASTGQSQPVAASSAHRTKAKSPAVPEDYHSDRFSIDSFSTPSDASPLSVEVRQLRHLIWTTRDGAPEATVTSMAQTSDGFLWIGTERGLIQFDGARFDDRIGKQLQGSSIYGILAEPNDDLWIGYTFGGISRVRNDSVVNYDLHGLESGSVFGFARGPDGALYAATTRYILKLVNDDQWRPLTSADGYVGGPPRWMGARNGALWILNTVGALVMPVGDKRFIVADPAKAESIKFGLPDNRKLPVNDFDDATLTDSSGSFWFEEYAKGMGRYRWTPASATTTPTKESFSDDKDGVFGVAHFFEDREGNIWAATSNGLEEFSATKFTPLSIPRDLAWPAVSIDHQGAMWIGSDNHDVLSLAGKEVIGHPGMGKDVSCVAADWMGVIWTANAEALHGEMNGNMTTLPLPTHSLGSNCQGIAGDIASGLWVSFARAGVYRWKGGAWSENGGHTDLPHGPAIRVLGDERHRVWFTYPDNRIAVLDAGTVRVYNEKDGLNVGNILGLFVHGSEVWAAGDKGVAYLKSDRFERLRGKTDEQFESTSGVVETASGELWLNSLDGVFRVAAAELHQAYVDPNYAVTYERFDEQDGLPRGRAPLFRPGPSMGLGTDGHIWVATIRGVAWINPEQILRNNMKPAVSVRSLTSGNTTWKPFGTVQLPVLTTHISIDYTAPSFTHPDRMKFRYQLDGVDKSRQEAGNRRTAYYTNLGPGHYHFSVTAVNEDGIASLRPADIYFTIAPTFYQTVWFEVLCGLVACFGVGLAFFLWLKVRLKQVAGRERMRFRERLAERERIARDLHDTLLQDIQTLVLQVGIVSENSEAPIRRTLADLFSLGQRTIVNARDRVHVLRHSSVPQSEDLTSELEEAGVSLGKYYATQFHLNIAGTPRELDPIDTNEVLAIGREAITNAFRHAHAETIEVTVDYQTKALHLVVDDDGIGVDPSALNNVDTQGHWGVLGMRERAANMDATFEIVARSPRGTRIKLVVPYSSQTR